MLFNLFKARHSGPDHQPVSGLTQAESQQERDLLNKALYSTLQTLPESFSGRENIRLLCDRVAAASPRLRLVWVGFSEGLTELVKPYAFAGISASEAQDWSLATDCFSLTGFFARDVSGSGDLPPMTDLFAPVRQEAAESSVCCALALPLRSEKPGLQGMIVFYADAPDYFERVGTPLFQAFCHLAEIIWKQSNLVHIATQVAQQDPLTNLMGRRQTMAVLEKEIARAEKRERPLSVLICKVDGLAKLNDMYGLQAADAILAAFAKEAGEQMRPGDLSGRWTGTEFLYVLPGTSQQEAAELAGRLAHYFRSNSVNVRNWSIRLALRIGTATHTRHSLGLNDLILLAHQEISATHAG